MQLRAGMDRPKIPTDTALGAPIHQISPVIEGSTSKKPNLPGKETKPESKAGLA